MVISKNRFTKEQREWIDELKSGKYKKSKGLLIIYNKDRITPKAFCCLGVRKYQLGKKPIDIVGSDVHYAVFRNHSQTLTIAESISLKLLSPTGTLKKMYFLQGLLIRSLSDINDQTNYSIKQIGNWIEEHPNLVFTNFNYK